MNGGSMTMNFLNTTPTAQFFSPTAYPLHTIKFIPETDMLFLCWNLESFHLHTGGVSRFTTQAMTWTGSFHTFIVHDPWTGSKTVRIWLKIEKNTFCWLPDMEIASFLSSNWARLSFSQRTARHGSQKLPLNGFTEWNFLRNKGKAYQNRESVWLCGGG